MSQQQKCLCGRAPTLGETVVLADRCHGQTQIATLSAWPSARLLIVECYSCCPVPKTAKP